MDIPITSDRWNSQYEIGSIHSTPSNFSNSSNFPSHGLIKISNNSTQDEFDSTNSSLNDPFNGCSNVNGSLIGIVKPENPHDRRISFHSTGNRSNHDEPIEEILMVDPQIHEPKTKPDLTHSHLRYNVTSLGSSKVGDLPIDGIERVKIILDRVIESYHGDRGVFLTKSIFLTKDIYSTQETIQNGSVKINIIQEINELLRKVLTDNQQTIPKLVNVQSTLNYYMRIMNAFEILTPEVYDSTIVDIDSHTSTLHTSTRTNLNNHTTSTTSSNYRVNSLESKGSAISETPEVPHTASSSDPSQQVGTHRKHNSLILERLKGKLKAKPKRVSLNDLGHHQTKTQVQHHNTKNPIHPTLTTQSAPGHTRSVSQSTITTQTSSRSAKDQASLQEYFQAFGFLHKTLIQTHALYIDSTNVEITDTVNEIIQFVNDYIIHFLLNDVFKLTCKHMSKLMQEMI